MRSNYRNFSIDRYNILLIIFIAILNLLTNNSSAQGTTCSTATPISINGSCLSGTISDNVQNLPNISSCPGTFGREGWYTFTVTGGPLNVTITSDTNNRNCFLQLISSTASCTGLSQINCANNVNSNGQQIETINQLLSNGIYYIKVVNLTNNSMTLNSLCVTGVVPPSNNQCANAISLPCGTSNLAGTTVNAASYSQSTGCSMSSYGVWYTFVGDGLSNSISITTTSYDIKMAIASGSCASLTNITCQDSALSSGTESYTFNTVLGTNYYIYVAHYSSSSSTTGTFTISRSCFSPPSNDDCSGATTLSVNSSCSYNTYSNAGATATTGVTAPGCASYSGGDVWFKVVVPSNGILQIDTLQGVITDGGMAIYSGVCGSLTLIECDDDDSANGLMPYIYRTGLTPGSTIYIRVWEYGNDNNGTFGICVTTPTPPTNDEPCNSIDLNVNTTCVYQTFSNLLATATPGIPAPGCANYLGGDVWFNFEVPANGIVRIDTNTGGILDGGMAVYSGTCGSLSLLQCDNDSSTNGAMPYLSLSGLTPGATLFIRFWEFGNDNNGTFNICISTPCTPGNGLGTTSAGCPVVIVGELGLNGVDPAPINACSATNCVDLEASYLALGQTTNYSVESIDYNPPPYQFGCLANPVSVNIDDVWSPVINLPFTFCFYGNTYNSCVMGSNGMLSFNTSGAGGPTGWAFSQNLPSTTGALFANTIYGVYHDIDPSKGGQVGWELITLSSGCRALIASWENVPMFRTNSILYTGMMVLYENTNIIEVYIKEKNVEFNGSNNWNDGNAIVGLQNSTGTQAVVAPGRNSLDANWTTSQEAWRFTPSGPSLTTIKWYEGSGTSGTLLGTSNTLTVCPTTTTTYTAQVSYTTCTGGTITVIDESVVTVLPSKTWNGSVNTDWNVNNNWTPIGIPNGSDCVTIPVTANNPIVSGSGYNALAGTLTINSNATLTISSNSNITVTDIITINTNANFILNNNANLVQINNTANVGNITYKRDASVRTLDYVYWASPVLGQNINSLFSPITPGPQYEWNTTIANSNGGQGNWVNLSSSTMQPGKGYIIRGPSSSPFNNSNSNTLTANFIGVPNNGTFLVPIYRGNDTNTSYHTGTNGVEITNLSDNWNLLGNPYPSSIRGSQFLFNNRTKIEGNIRLWTHGNLPVYLTNPFYNSFVYNYTAGDYLTYNFTGASCCPAAPSDLFIGAGQSFFVQMKDGAAATDVVTFNNGLRSASYPNNNFYRTQNITENNTQLNINGLERNRIWLDIINANSQSSRTLFGYIEGATSEWDSFYDCLTQENGSMDIYSLIEDKKFSIQGRPLPFNDEDIVPIGVSIQTSGNYSIGIAGVDGLFTYQSIYLKDNLLNIYHDLKNEPYQFTIPSGVNNTRFEIVYRNNTLEINDYLNDQDINVIVNNYVTVKSDNSIKEIIVYNVLGQIIDRYSNISSNEITLSSLVKNRRTLLLKIKLNNGKVVSKKILF
jgi:hypothetical protein